LYKETPKKEEVTVLDTPHVHLSLGIAPSNCEEKHKVHLYINLFFLYLIKPSLDEIL